MEQKKRWAVPSVVVFGGFRSLTQQTTIPKVVGETDYTYLCDQTSLTDPDDPNLES